MTDELWDSLSEISDSILLTEGEAEEVDRRLEAYRQDGNPGEPWAKVLKEIEKSGS